VVKPPPPVLVSGVSFPFQVRTALCETPPIVTVTWAIELLLSLREPPFAGQPILKLKVNRASGNGQYKPLSSTTPTEGDIYEARSLI
jgi:hypothetical protein